MSSFNESALRRWRRLLLVRDCTAMQIPGEDKFVRLPFCPMCQTVFDASRLQAHHIRPKSLFPERAYDLDNGIMLCLSCHMAIVHRGNSFNDLRKWHHWKFFVPTFDRYVELAVQRRFNEENQYRIAV